MTPDPANEYALPDSPTSKLCARDLLSLILERKRARELAADEYAATRLQRRGPGW